jgi:Helitron helicase-like domain at N-terminus
VLFSQPIFCDMWAQVEARACYFHSLPQQQKLYRASRVAAVEDQLHRGVPAGDIGQTVVRLPASFVGSARFYQQLYLDALALPRRFGKPDLFITVTCNPKWPEIGLALPAGAKWQDHPDIVSRVFMLKLKCIISDFKIGQIFGVLKAYVYRIEWQARGLPHAHMLLILEHKIMTAAQIDAIVSAEMPDPVDDPILHSLVSGHMLHPRCDVVLQQEKHSCRADKAGLLCDCRRRFPKAMGPATVIIGDGFPQYRRRGLYTATDRSGRIVTDSWVVPHSPYLILKYQCHINVEVRIPAALLFSTLHHHRHTS